MFLTTGGIPAGYGYFLIPSVANVDIINDLILHLKANDLENNGRISIQTMSIQVDSDTQVSINNRSPIFIKADTTFSCDVVGIFSLKFLTNGANYNICVSY